MCFPMLARARSSHRSLPLPAHLVAQRNYPEQVEPRAGSSPLRRSIAASSPQILLLVRPFYSLRFISYKKFTDGLDQTFDIVAARLDADLEAVIDRRL